LKKGIYKSSNLKKLNEKWFQKSEKLKVLSPLSVFKRFA
jgi:hypothetical protein